MKNKMEMLQSILYSFLGVWLILLIIGFFISGCSVVRTDISSGNYKEGMIYYYLPQSLIKITSTVKVAVFYNSTDNTLTESNKLIEQKFVVTSENIADTKELLALKYKSNAFMSDYLKYQVNDKGLLESIKVTTEDKTAAIINKITNAPEQILRIESSLARANNVILKIKEYSTDFYVKASEIMGKPKTLEWNLLILNELGKEEFKTVEASFDVKIKRNRQTTKTIKEISAAKKEYVEGILTRPLLNSDLEISTKLITGTPQVSEMNIRIIDQEKLINIPIKRTAFAKRENEIIIQEGLIKSNEITNPSSVEGFVSIPIDVAKAIVSIPGQLITFRYDNTVRLKKLEDEKSLLESKLLESEKFQLSRESEINKLLDEIKKDELTRENDSKILTLELQKQLLEAEKNQLQMLKELEELKKVIEELKTK